MINSRFMFVSMLNLLLSISSLVLAADHPSDFRLAWKGDALTIRGQNLPGEELKVWYLEAYCRDGSTHQDWKETMVGHTTKLVAASEDGRYLQLECTLDDGVVVTHSIRAVDDGVDFRLKAHNPTDKSSHTHWAQPCIRVGKFTGTASGDALAVHAR